MAARMAPEGHVLAAPQHQELLRRPKKSAVAKEFH
jgi:hypothetical protein